MAARQAALVPRLWGPAKTVAMRWGWRGWGESPAEAAEKGIYVGWSRPGTQDLAGTVSKGGGSERG